MNLSDLFQILSTMVGAAVMITTGVLTLYLGYRLLYRIVHYFYPNEVNKR